MNEKLAQDEFPKLKEIAYLNSAATGIPPKGAIEKAQEYLLERMTRTITTSEVNEIYDSIRKNLGMLFNAPEDTFAIVNNTSDGLNKAATSINIKENEKIIISDQEFPANQKPWQLLSKRTGAKLVVIKSKNGAVPLDDLLAEIDEKTKIIALSHVEFSTGFRNNMKKISKEAHKYDTYVIADIIQSAGSLKIDLKDLDVDFATAATHKWLLGPLGLGFLYVNQRILDNVEPIHAGWHSVKNMNDFSFRELEFRDDAGKFENGTKNIVGMIMFNESLKIINTLNIEKISKHNIDLAKYMRRQLKEMNIEVYEFPEEETSSIVSIEIKDAEEKYKKIIAQNIVCALRLGRLRVAIHLYNDKNDIDKVLRILNEK